MLTTLIAFALALGILITFHEFGHYWVARRCGVRVLRFSVGFGPVLARKTDRNGTEWAISAIPLGGYVKMQDEPDPKRGAQGVAEAFQSQSVYRRMAIVAAGPLFNLILAVALYAGLNMVGTREPASVIGPPPVGTPAYVSGMTAGERIIAVNSVPIHSWGQLRWEIMQLMSKGGTVDIESESSGVKRTRLITLPQILDPSKDDPMKAAGLGLNNQKPVINSIVEGGAAQAAGILSGDLIVGIPGMRDPTIREVIDFVQRHAGVPIELMIERGSSRLTVIVVPEAQATDSGQPVGRMGVRLGAEIEQTLVRYGPIESIWNGVVKTWDTAWFSVRMMGRMITGDVSVKNISGPVTIADYAGQTARIGLAAYIAFLALVSVSLGVLNLLPIPMLDGGHLLYYLIEIVRGSPPPQQWIAIGQRAGVGLLASLMVLALFNDLTRLFT